MDGSGSILVLAYGFFWVLAIVYFGVILWMKYSYAKQDAAARAAQKLELAPGVTLMWALQCFFGGGSRWKVSRGLVYVESGFWDKDKKDGFVNGVELVLCVDPKSGRIEVASCRLGGGCSTENLIDALIRAASEQ